MSVQLIWHALRRGFPTLMALLAASAASCLVCGKRCDAKRQGSFGSLCTYCFRGIPWITRIYCPVCGRPEHCPDCARRTGSALIANRSAVRYDTTIREWLALYKYRGHEALEPLLGQMLGMAYRGLRAEHVRAGCDPWEPHAIIPVPVSEVRLQERGFNQAERLAACLGETEGLPLYDMLRRTRHSDKQSLKTRDARLRDTHHLFQADEAALTDMLQELNQHQPGAAPQGGSYRFLLIDDIYTTGSTANACAQALEESVKRAAPSRSCEIYCLTLARS